VWFSALLDANSAVDAGQDELFAVSANLSPVFFLYSHFCGHGDASCDCRVSLCQFWVFVDVFFCEAEERVDSLAGDLLGSVHQLRFLQSIADVPACL